MALRLEIKVVPSAGKTLCIIDKNQQLKCYLKSAAQDGKANKELIKYIAELCSVTQRDVDIVAGLTSRHKVLLITTSKNYEDFLQILGFAQQHKLF